MIQKYRFLVKQKYVEFYEKITKSYWNNVKNNSKNYKFYEKMLDKGRGWLNIIVQEDQKC